MKYLQKYLKITVQFIASLMMLATATSPIFAFSINKCIVNGEAIYTETECPKNTEIDLELKELTSMPEQRITPKKLEDTGYKSDVWYKDDTGYKKALVVSEYHEVPILIYAFSDDCADCVRFEKKLLQNTEVKETLNNFAKVKINGAHSPEDKKLIESFGDSKTPVLFIQEDIDSVVVKTNKKLFDKDNGKIIADDVFINMLKSYLPNQVKNIDDLSDIPILEL